MKSKKKLRSFLKSLRFRLIVVLVIFGIVPGFALRIGLLRAYESRAVANRTIDILSQAKILSDQIANNGYLEDVSQESINSKVELICNIYDGRILVVDNTFHIIKDTYDLDTSKIIISEEVATSFQGKESSKYDSLNRYIQLTLPIRNVETQQILGVLLVSVSTDNVRDALAYLKNVALIIQLSVSILLVVCAILAANHISRRISRSVTVRIC